MRAPSSSTAPPCGRASSSPCRPTAREITTVEGVTGPDGELHPVQQALRDSHAFQCGFCTPGFVMAIYGMCEDQKAGRPVPCSRAEIREELSGNICRCTGYQSIVDGAEAALAGGEGVLMAGGSAISGLVGARVHRKEDRTILTGTGRYIDDVRERGMLHAHFLRSTVAHGRITGIDVEEARKLEGVVRIFTGTEMSAIADDLSFAAADPRPAQPVLPGDRARRRPLRRRAGGPDHRREPLHRRGRGRHDRDRLRTLDPVMSTTAGLADGAPELFGEVVPGNVVHADEQLFGDIEAAFAQADHVVTQTLDQHRWACNPMECRGGVATYERGSGQLTYEASTQTTHTLRFLLAGWIRHPIHRFRVTANNIGGGFGLKFSAYREDVAVCAAAKAMGGRSSGSRTATST